MGFFKRIAGLLGLARDDSEDESDDQPRTHHSLKDTGLPRKGFSVTKQVVVDRPQLGPVVAPSTFGDGGVQVLNSLVPYPLLLYLSRSFGFFFFFFNCIEPCYFMCILVLVIY